MGQNTSDKLEQISEQFIGGANDQIANLMTGKKSNFSGLFSNTAHSMAVTGLEKLESGIAGKPTGKRGEAKNNPLYTEVVNLAHSPLSSAAGASDISGDDNSNGRKSILGKLFSSSILGKLFSSLNDSDALSSLFGGHLFGAGSLFGGFRAAGGPVFGDMPYIVGEKGPELMIPHSSGSIVPNNQLGSMATMNNYTIDARGTDPALVQQSVYQGMSMVSSSSYRDWETDRKSTRLNSSHSAKSRMPSSA